MTAQDMSSTGAQVCKILCADDKKQFNCDYTNVHIVFVPINQGSRAKFGSRG